MRRKSGITLIALVITIIVLLILAGVTISSITGDNGILTKASKAKEETRIRGLEEELELKYSTEGISIETGSTETYLEDVTDFGSGSDETGTFNLVEYKDEYFKVYYDGEEDNVTDVKYFALEVLEIHNCDEMIAFAERVNGGENFSNYIVRLKADLDFEGAEWDTIGYSSLRANDAYADSYFAGIFDGEDHVISGLTIADTRYEAGIFGNNQGTIKNLNVEDFTVNKTTSYVCYIAGIAASNGGIVENCSADVTITFSSSSSQYSSYVGGIVGSGGTVRNCTSYGTINAAGAVTNVGGIAGQATNISRAINYAQLVGTSKCKYLSGIVGENGNIVEKSINYGTISTVNGATAGVCGFTRGIIKECANKGTITSTSGGTQPYPEVAGICNRIYYGGSIESCYNTGTLESPTSKYYYAYGIVGSIDEVDASIKNCYSSCTITDAQYGNERGAFPYVGNITYTGILNCYYNSEICTAPENYAQAYTTSQMKESSFASLLGSAFKTDTNTVNNGYPVFSWE